MHTRQGDLFNHISTRIYNPSSGPRITRFLAVVAKKWKISGKSLFWNERTQRAHSRWQQESYFTNFSIIYFQIGIIFQLNYYIPVTKPSITYKQKEITFCRYNMAFTGMLCRFTIRYDSLLLKEHVQRTQGG